MDLVVILALLGLAAMSGLLIGFGLGEAGEDRSQAATRAEMEVLRACLRLCLVAWQVREEMASEAKRPTVSRP